MLTIAGTDDETDYAELLLARALSAGGNAFDSLLGRYVGVVHEHPSSVSLKMRHPGMLLSAVRVYVGPCGSVRVYAGLRGSMWV